MDNLKRIKKYLETEKIQAVHIGQTTKEMSAYPLNADFSVLTIETNKHTIILTLEAYNYLSLKDYYPKGE